MSGCGGMASNRHARREARAEVREARLHNKAAHAAMRGNVARAARLEMKANVAHRKAEREHILAHATSRPNPATVVHVVHHISPTPPPPAYSSAQNASPAAPTDYPAAPTGYPAPPSYPGQPAYPAASVPPYPGPTTHPNPYT
ncbi:extensin-like [Acanthaster planci]|uniref:Extensin-like n=1 Tax=Acanthaster planci TaxID=133434 RepID=A0A8B7XXL7_ACAPL|nr:extensin-like [Acanthaster planci]